MDGRKHQLLLGIRSYHVAHWHHAQGCAAPPGQSPRDHTLKAPPLLYFLAGSTEPGPSHWATAPVVLLIIVILKQGLANHWIARAELKHSVLPQPARLLEVPPLNMVTGQWHFKENFGGNIQQQCSWEEGEVTSTLERSENLVEELILIIFFMNFLIFWGASYYWGQFCLKCTLKNYH